MTALDYAKLVIKSYEADMRNVRVLGDVRFVWHGRGTRGKTLADHGLCQGTIYKGALEEIARLEASYEP